MLGIGGSAISVSTGGQYGFNTVAIARKDKELLAKSLGAQHYTTVNVGSGGGTDQLGGAKVIIATVTNGDAMAAVSAALDLTERSW